MTEYRFVTFRQKAGSVVPPAAGGVAVLTVDFAKSIPELSEHMDGWEPVNFQFHPMGDEVLLVVLLRTEVDTDKLTDNA